MVIAQLQTGAHDTEITFVKGANDKDEDVEGNSRKRIRELAFGNDKGSEEE